MIAERSVNKLNYEETTKIDGWTLRGTVQLQSCQSGGKSDSRTRPRRAKIVYDHVKKRGRERKRERERERRQEEDQEEAPAAGGFNLQFRKST